MKNLIAVIIFLLVCGGVLVADTFTHTDGKTVYHGYATSKIDGGKTVVMTEEAGEQKLNLAEFKVRANLHGRKNSVAVLSVPADIGLHMETDAFNAALTEEADKGPLFVLIEIDSPGGRTDLAMEMCAAIIGTKHCKTVAYVKGGPNVGAISAAAAIALACDEIYMAGNTVMGAATVIAITDRGRAAEIKDVAGEVIGEKIGSMWRNYLASLAEQNGRPGLLAKAMEDKGIEVVEVYAGGKRKFVEPYNVRTKRDIVHTWCKKGTLLTLTAEEAVKSGMADKVINSRQELLAELGASSAEVAANDKPALARKEYETKIKVKFERLDKNIDKNIKTLMSTNSGKMAMGMFRRLIKDIKMMIMLKQKYPDVPVDEEELIDLLGSVEGNYNSLKPRFR